jgi:hypothetical protein
MSGLRGHNEVMNAKGLLSLSPRDGAEDSCYHGKSWQLVIPLCSLQRRLTAQISVPKTTQQGIPELWGSVWPQVTEPQNLRVLAGSDSAHRPLLTHPTDMSALPITGIHPSAMKCSLFTLTSSSCLFFGGTGV